MGISPNHGWNKSWVKDSRGSLTLHTDCTLYPGEEKRQRDSAGRGHKTHYVIQEESPSWDWELDNR